MFVSVKKMRAAAKKTRASVKKMHDCGKRPHVNVKKLHASVRKLLLHEPLNAPLLARPAMLNAQRALKLVLMLLTLTKQTLRMLPKKLRSHLSVSSQVAIAAKATAAKVMAKRDEAGADVDVVVADAVVIVMTKHQRTETVAVIAKADAMLRATTLLVRQPPRALRARLAQKAPKAVKLLTARHVAMAAKAAKAERTARASVDVDVVAAVVVVVAIGLKARMARKAHHRVTAVRPQQVMRRNLALEANHWAHLRDQAAGAPRANRASPVNHVNRVMAVAHVNRAPTALRATMPRRHRHNHRTQRNQTPLLQTLRLVQQRRRFAA